MPVLQRFSEAKQPAQADIDKGAAAAAASTARAEAAASAPAPGAPASIPTNVAVLLVAYAAVFTDPSLEPQSCLDNVSAGSLTFDGVHVTQTAMQLALEFELPEDKTGLQVAVVHTFLRAARGRQDNPSGAGTSSSSLGALPAVPPRSSVTSRAQGAAKAV